MDQVVEGDLAVFRNGKWVPMLNHPGDGVKMKEEALQEDRKKMYDDGIRFYYEKSSGIKMTLRPDGTEYIDKCDMPA